MLLSLDRAARFVLAKLGYERGAEHLETLRPLARLWGERARGCFLEGYAEGAHDAASYPEIEEQVGALVQLFMVEKGLQEISLELDTRPERAGDPISDLIELLERKKP